MKKYSLLKKTFVILLLTTGIFSSAVFAYDIPEFQNISEEGYFILTKDGVTSEFSESEEILKLEWYMDALCPDCCRAHKNTKELVAEKMEEGVLEIKYFPLNFLPQHSENDYPLHAAAWTLGVAEYAPESIVPFMDLLFAFDENEEDEARNDRLNDEFIENCAREAGVSDEASEQIVDAMYFLKATVNGASVGIRENKELLEKSPEDRVFVPFIYTDLLSKALDGESEDAADLLDPINTLIETLTGCGDFGDEEGC